PISTAPVTTQGWFGSGPYQFKEPGGVAVAPSGLIAVTDGGTGRVEFFNNRFEYIGQWTAKDEILSQGFNPRFRGIAFDKDNRLYVADMQDCVIVRLKLIKAPVELTPLAPTPTPQDTNPYGGPGFPIR